MWWGKGEGGGLKQGRPGPELEEAAARQELYAALGTEGWAVAQSLLRAAVPTEAGPSTLFAVAASEARLLAAERRVGELEGVVAALGLTAAETEARLCVVEEECGALLADAAAHHRQLRRSLFGPANSSTVPSPITEPGSQGPVGCFGYPHLIAITIFWFGFFLFYAAGTNSHLEQHSSRLD